VALAGRSRRIFVPQDDAVQRPARRLPVGEACRIERVLLVYAQEAVQPGLRLVRALENRLHRRHGGDVPLANRRRELQAGKRKNLVPAHGA
jgi:hypothetical protein